MSNKLKIVFIGLFSCVVGYLVYNGITQIMESFNIPLNPWVSVGLGVVLAFLGWYKFG